MASPEEIYLQWYDENGEEPQDGSEVTWCQDRINDTDVRYVKLSFITAIQEKLSKDESEIAELTSTCSQCKEPAWCETKAENKRLTKELAEAQAEVDRLEKELVLHNSKPLRNKPIEGKVYIGEHDPNIIVRFGDNEEYPDGVWCSE